MEIGAAQELTSSTTPLDKDLRGLRRRRASRGSGDPRRRLLGPAYVSTRDVQLMKILRAQQTKRLRRVYIRVARSLVVALQPPPSNQLYALSVTKLQGTIKHRVLRSWLWGKGNARGASSPESNHPRESLTARIPFALSHALRDSHLRLRRVQESLLH